MLAGEDAAGLLSPKLVLLKRSDGEETLYYSEAMQPFCRDRLGDDRDLRNETTILNFRHLLERHGLTEAIADVNAHLADRASPCGSGTLIDATIIDRCLDEDIRSGARDPEMSPQKGNDTGISA